LELLTKGRNFQNANVQVFHCEKVEILNYAKDHPSGYRKSAEIFVIGRTQAYKILKERDAILVAYERNSEPKSAKESPLSKLLECK